MNLEELGEERYRGKTMARWEEVRRGLEGMGSADVRRKKWRRTAAAMSRFGGCAIGENGRK